MNFQHIQIFLFALFLWGTAFGQEKPATSSTGHIVEIVIDLADTNGIDPLQIAKYNALGKGQFFRLKIQNVNTYLYDTSVFNEDIHQNTTLPENVLDFIDFGGLKSSLANLNSVSTVVRHFVALGKQEGIQAYDVNGMQTVATLKEYFARIESDYKFAFESIESSYMEADAFFVRAEDYRNLMMTVEKDVFGVLPSKNDIKVIMVAFGNTKAHVIETKARLRKLNLEFLSVIATNQETIAKNLELKGKSAEIKKVAETLVKASNTLMAQLSTENYAIFSRTLIGILNNLDFSYSTLPIQRHGDVNELSITLKPRDKNAKLSGYSTLLRIPDIEKSFWGVSTGFYMTDNPERNYSVVERVENGQALYDFLEEDTASVELGINTLVRYGRRVGEIFNTPTFWHFGFGAGLSIDQKFKPRLMAGTGLAFGRKNKLFIDIGALHMYYNTLSKAYTLKGNTVLPDDYLVNATKINGYVSLGYLISL